MSASLRPRAILMLLLATVAWGYSFPGMKALLSALDAALPGRSEWFFSSLLISARFALAGLLLLAVRPRALAEMRPGEWRQGLGLGVFAGLGMLFQADGLQYTSASSVAFLTQFSAVLVPLYCVWRDRRLPSARTIFCVAMVLVGVGILGQFEWRAMRLGRGEFESLLATFFFTTQILWLDHPHFRGNDSGRMSIAMFGAIALVLAPVWIIHAHSLADAAVIFATPAIGSMFVSVTLICSICAFLLMNYWQPRLDATTAGIIYCAEPVFATLLALFLPVPLGHWLGIEYANEGFTLHLLLGGGLITAANILISIQPRREV
ncbi:MAG: DMT family transporter [Chthoniobacteraceae bacterium]